MTSALISHVLHRTVPLGWFHNNDNDDDDDDDEDDGDDNDDDDGCHESSVVWCGVGWAV